MNQSQGGEVRLVEVEDHHNDNKANRNRCQAGCDKRAGPALLRDVKTVAHLLKAIRMRQRWHLNSAISYSNPQTRSGKQAKSKWRRPWQTSSRSAMLVNRSG